MPSLGASVGGLALGASLSQLITDLEVKRSQGLRGDSAKALLIDDGLSWIPEEPEEPEPPVLDVVETVDAPLEESAGESTWGSSSGLIGTGVGGLLLSSVSYAVGRRSSTRPAAQVRQAGVRRKISGAVPARSASPRQVR